MKITTNCSTSFRSPLLVQMGRLAKARRQRPGATGDRGRSREPAMDVAAAVQMNEAVETK